MQGERHAFLFHGGYEQAHGAHHDNGVAGLDGDDHVGKLLGHADAQELHARLYHALGCVAIAAHDAIAERTVIHADADGCVVLLTDVEKGYQLGAYLFNLVRILLIGVGELLEGAGGVDIVAGVDAHLLGIERRHIGHAGIEVHVGHEGGVNTLATQCGINLA